MPSAAIARPGQCGDARHTSRSAIRPKPIGSARSATQIGSAAGDQRRRRGDRSARARSPPSARIVATIAPTVPAKTCATALIAALRQELAGGEREQLAVARRDRGAEHAEPQRQRRRDRRRSPGSRRRETCATRSRPAGAA